MSGWICLHRSMLDHWLWEGEKFTRAQAWLDLLLWARFAPGEVRVRSYPVRLNRGQQARSEVTLSRTWGWSRDRVRRFLDRLVSEGMIVQEKTHHTTIITICNYDDFQVRNTASDTGVDTRTQHEPNTTQDTIEQGNKDNNGNNPTPEDSGESSVLRCPHGEIIDAWAEVMPDKQQVRKNMWKSTRKEYRHLAARWREMASTLHSQTGEPLYTSKEEGIAWWKAFFRHIRKSEFLMNDQPWFNLGWVVNKTNFYKIIEGNYHEGNS